MSCVTVHVWACSLLSKHIRASAETVHSYINRRKGSKNKFSSFCLLSKDASNVVCPHFTAGIQYETNITYAMIVTINVLCHVSAASLCAIATEVATATGCRDIGCKRSSLYAQDLGFGRPSLPTSVAIIMICLFHRAVSVDYSGDELVLVDIGKCEFEKVSIVLYSTTILATDLLAS